MERSVLYTRLVVATAAAAASALFVALYSLLSLIVLPGRVHVYLKPDDLMRWLPACTRFMVHYCWYAFSAPALLFAFGAFALHRWKNRAAFELALGCQWLFAIVWFALCLLAWLLPEVPSIGRTHGAG
jgi:hypothetical protein